jgi:hypothetical protein
MIGLTFPLHDVGYLHLNHICIDFIQLCCYNVLVTFGNMIMFTYILCPGKRCKSLFINHTLCEIIIN